MAMRRIKFVFGFLLAAIIASTQATEIPVLDSLIQVARNQNPTIEAARQKLSAQEYRESYAGWLPDPQLSVGWLNLPRSSLALDETPMSGVQIGLMQKIPWPGKLSARSELAQLRTQSRNWDIAVASDRVTSLVETSYYDYSWSVLAADIYDHNLRLVETIIEVVQTRYANGQSSAQDVLRAQTAKARLENKLLQLEQHRQAALARLAWLTNDPAAAEAELTVALPDVADFSDESMSTPAGFLNPTLAKAAVGSSIAERQLSLAKADYWPDLSVGLDYRFRKDIPMDAVRGEDFLTFKVGLSVPLWFFKKQSGQTAAAGSSLLAAKAEEKSLQNLVTQQVTDTRLALESVVERVRQYDRSILPQAKAALEAARIAYEVGKVDFNGYLATVLDIIDIELERLQLVRQYHHNSARMRQLTTGTN